MIETFDKYNFILGSGSPRRSQLLSEIGLNFRTIVSDAAEIYDEDMNVYHVAEYLAELKSDSLFGNLMSRDLMITADSVVIYDNKILGKPKDLEEAKAVLGTLGGNMHEVISGVCLRTIDRKKSFSVRTEVVFDTLTDREIEYYVDKYKPLDKAGSYGVQEWIGHCKVKSMIGSYTNVMGLPMRELYKVLREEF